MHLQSSSEFLEFLKSAGKSFNLPGHMSHPESARKGGLGVGFWDTWRTRTLSGGFSRLGCRDVWHFSHGIRRVVSASALGVGFRHTWHAPKENLKGSLSVAFGTRGTL